MDKEIITTKNLTLTPVNGSVTISLLEIDHLRQEAATWAKTARELEAKQMEVKIEVYSSQHTQTNYNERRREWNYEEVKNIKNIQYVNLESVKENIRKEEVIRLEKTIKDAEDNANVYKNACELAEKSEKECRSQAAEANDKYGKLIGDLEKAKKDYDSLLDLSEMHTKNHNDISNEYFKLKTEFKNLQEQGTLKYFIKKWFHDTFKSKINLKKR